MFFTCSVMVLHHNVYYKNSHDFCFSIIMHGNYLAIDFDCNGTWKLHAPSVAHKLPILVTVLLKSTLIYFCKKLIL